MAGPNDLCEQIALAFREFAVLIQRAADVDVVPVEQHQPVPRADQAVGAGAGQAVIFTSATLDARPQPQQLVAHLPHDAGPISCGRLTKQAKRGVPHRIFAVQQPPPIGHMRQRQPRGHAQRAGQMRDGGVHGDQQIQVPQHGRRVHKGAARFIQFVRQGHDLQGAGQIVNLFGSQAFLQAEPVDAFQLAQRREFGQRHAPHPVGLVFGTALPRQADLAAAIGL